MGKKSANKIPKDILFIHKLQHENPVSEKGKNPSKTKVVSDIIEDNESSETEYTYSYESSNEESESSESSSRSLEHGEPKETDATSPHSETRILKPSVPAPPSELPPNMKNLGGVSSKTKEKKALSTKGFGSSGSVESETLNKRASRKKQMKQIQKQQKRPSETLFSTPLATSGQTSVSPCVFKSPMSPYPTAKEGAISEIEPALWRCPHSRIIVTSSYPSIPYYHSLSAEFLLRGLSIEDVWGSVESVKDRDYTMVSNGTLLFSPKLGMSSSKVAPQFAQQRAEGVSLDPAYFNKLQGSVFVPSSHKTTSLDPSQLSFKPTDIAPASVPNVLLPPAMHLGKDWKDHNPPRKMYERRQALFSRFDDCLLTHEAFYSITPHSIADSITTKLCDRLDVLYGGGEDRYVVVDVCAGAGGNAISIARDERVKLVVCIDVDPFTIQCLVHNAHVYGVAHKIMPIVASYEVGLRQVSAMDTKIHAILSSPPWGGEMYARTGYPLATAVPLPGGFCGLLHSCLSLCSEVMFVLPRSLKFDTVSSVCDSEPLCRGTVEVQQCFDDRTFVRVLGIWVGGLVEDGRKGRKRRGRERIIEYKKRKGEDISDMKDEEEMEQCEIIEEDSTGVIDQQK
ncbi:RNA cap guanine-N2 methyltransferase like protein [Aduncisulcus paluster]|uniref:Trimethylguanosine synthase n=1 Tax=Aduncisulcus paluster TaxID=2918883 RepID=A0ABQ5KIR1_9EUKA|nr:RNA cap guanine-N2 methyltransferase like protein [Aduncisulcus paluster]